MLGVQSTPLRQAKHAADLSIGENFFLPHFGHFWLVLAFFGHFSLDTRYFGWTTGWYQPYFTCCFFCDFLPVFLFDFFCCCGMAFKMSFDQGFQLVKNQGVLNYSFAVSRRFLTFFGAFFSYLLGFCNFCLFFPFWINNHKPSSLSPPIVYIAN